MVWENIIMSNFDSAILIRNIQKLMADNGITQSALADILDMSQPNVSKALSLTDKKSFTLDQVVGIAKHFNVSVDMLLGNHQADKYDISPRAIAEYFVQLIENGDIKFFKYSVEEEIYEPYFNHETREADYKEYTKAIGYDAFYFPDYWHIPDGLSYDEECGLFAEMTQCGNDTIHVNTNKFFHRFLQIYGIYKQKGLEEDTYRTVVSDLLSHLRK